MAVTVKRVTLWRGEVGNQPGTLARVLEPLAGAGVDLQVVMGYRIPGDHTRSVIELAPVAGKKATAGAQSSGLAASAIPTLLVAGENMPGLGHAMARDLAAAGINISFLVAQVVGRRYSAVVGLESEADAKKAAGIIKRTKAAKKR